MDLAFKLALKGKGKTWTNPLVGAVIVKNGEILATGYHHQFGKEHAEIDALNRLENINAAFGATNVCEYGTVQPLWQNPSLCD